MTANCSRRKKASTSKVGQVSSQRGDADGRHAEKAFVPEDPTLSVAFSDLCSMWFDLYGKQIVMRNFNCGGCGGWWKKNCYGAISVFRDFGAPDQGHWDTSYGLKRGSNVKSGGKWWPGRRIKRWSECDTAPEIQSPLVGVDTILRTTSRISSFRSIGCLVDWSSHVQETCTYRD